MSHGYKGPSVAARDAIAAILDKAWEMPRRGTSIGKGVRVAMPATWDGNGAVPIGWTSHRAHRTDDEDMLWLPEPETQTKLARLTAGEQAQLAAAREQAEPHDPEAEGAPNAKPNQSR